jgi:PadR family transcriptional regulator PadR
VGRLPGRGGGFGGFGWWLSAFALLLIAEKPRHGYEIASELRETGFPIFGIGQMGTVYRTLASLEASGFVMPNWDTTVSPPRKVYRITPLGMEYLRNVEMELEGMKKLIDEFVERFRRLEKSDDNQG